MLPVLNYLIQPGRVPDVVRNEFMSQLALLPLRSDGVRATLEFVFSVHPSNANSNASAPQKQGAQITLEALKMATRLLASPPVRATAEDWFKGIAPQLLALLDGHDGLELAKVAAYVIGFGILGRKSFGAPGTPGWNNFAEPMLRCIDPTTSQTPAQTAASRGGEDIVDLRRNAAAVLVTEDNVAEGLRRLQTLIISHPNPGLTRRLLNPVVLPLWALSSWTNASKKCEEDYCLPARNLLKIYLKISTAPDKLMPIVRDLLFEGSKDASKTPQWQYQATDANQNRICIVSSPSTPPTAAEVLQTRWNEIGPKSDALVDLLASISTDDEDISSVFLDLFSCWLSSKKPKRKANKGLVLIKEEDDDDDDDQKEGLDSNPLADVLEGSILQKMMEKFPEKLAGRPDHILELVSGLLSQQDEESLAEDETVPLLMSLLNLVVTSPGFRRAKADPTIVQSIEDSLAKVSRASGSDEVNETAKTAKNLLLFLKYRDKIEDPEAAGNADNTTSATSQQQIEDRKTYSLAISYITQADSPPPVRSEGLNLLQGLIQSHSSILDIPSLLVMMSSMLDENEDYVNLRVIKIFTLLADKHPKSTTKELLDHYVDANEMKSVDTRLRFGEALLQVVQRLGATFAGETAEQVGQALLEIAGRRGHRPKTEAKQAREQRMRDLKAKRKTTDDNADEDEDIDMEDALLTDEERKRNEILGRIVEGWGSKRGSEDVRIRASSLSIMASGIDVNIAGLGATLASGAVDLSLHILTMEPELEKAILRRAAIVLILSFVRALHDAREAGRRLGFGLTQQSQDDILRILKYVADTDKDGLVKQHAIDVTESLENWQMTSILPPASESGNVLSGGPSLGGLSGLSGLAGLSINPANIGTTTSSTTGVSSSQQLPIRPRIEEIE